MAELSERGRLVGVPQKRRMEAVFSTVRSASQWNVGSKLPEYIAAYVGVNDFE